MAGKSIAQQQRERLEKGAKLAALGSANSTRRNVWEVENGGGHVYTVRVNENDRPTHCNCKDFEQRGDVVGMCKHQRAVFITAKAHQRISATADLGTLYGQTLIALTLSNGWEADALNCLLHMIEVRERLAAPARF